MEQHPIPQNITGFEFKLIGDMTIKQFAYLVACLILAYITYVLPFYGVIKYPLMFILILLGIGLAFVPIEGRPLDRWILSFVKALFSPNQYIFHKQGSTPDFFQVRNATLSQVKTAQAQQAATLKASQEPTRLEQYLQGLPSVQHNIPGVDTTHPRPLHPLQSSSPMNSPLPSTPKPVQDLHEVKKTEEYHSVASLPSMQTMQPPIDTIPVPVTKQQPEGITPPPSHETEQKPDHVSILYEENKKLREELEKIKQHVFSQKPASTPPPSVSSVPTPGQVTSPPSPSPLYEPLKPMVPDVKPVPPAPPVQPVAMHKPAPVIPKTTPKVDAFAKAPNLINGYVTDAQGDGLPNIIVEVKDTQGLPVRAFKTNSMGQFTAATSVANGTYTIELEDPKKTYTFPMAQIQANGTPLQPLTIAAKDLSQTQREKLHSALFGGTT